MRTSIFSLIIFVQLCLCVQAELPTLSSESSDTENALKWCQQSVKKVEKDKSLRGVEFSDFQTLLKHFEGLEVKLTLENKKYDADLQKIHEFYTVFLYWWGQKAPSEEKSKKVLALLKKMEAPREFSIPFLAQLKQWEGFYKETRRELEVYESDPDRFRYSPIVPPLFLIQKSHSTQTLHHILAIYDLCKKQHWHPSREEEERILMGLANLYEQRGLIPYAITALSLSSLRNQSLKIPRETLRLKKIQKKKKQSPLY